MLAGQRGDAIYAKSIEACRGNRIQSRRLRASFSRDSSSRGIHRRRSPQFSLLLEMEHESTDGLHHQKTKGFAFFNFYVLVMRCEFVAQRNLKLTRDTEGAV